MSHPPLLELPHYGNSNVTRNLCNNMQGGAWALTINLDSVVRPSESHSGRLNQAMRLSRFACEASLSKWVSTVIFRSPRHSQKVNQTQTGPTADVFLKWAFTSLLIYVNTLFTWKSAFSDDDDDANDDGHDLWQDTTACIVFLFVVCEIWHHNRELGLGLVTIGHNRWRFVTISEVVVIMSEVAVIMGEVLVRSQWHTSRFEKFCGSYKRVGTLIQIKKNLNFKIFIIRL